MKNLVAGAALLLTVSGNLLCQQTSDVHQQTTPPPGARFEVVQSELAAKWTFRLDRFTGHVAQLVTNLDQNSTWENMVVFDLPPATGTPHPKFQIFTSGIAARHTFLIDTETGNTWLLTSGRAKDASGIEQEYSSWEPFSP